MKQASPLHFTWHLTWRYGWVIALILCGAISQTATAQTPTKRVRFYFNLNFGEAVDIDLYGSESPLHVANFLGYVNNDAYDGSYIHRARTSLSSPTRFLQGGSFYLPQSPSTTNLADLPITPGDPVPNEFNAANGLSNTVGTLAAARATDPDSATSGWFFNITDNSSGFDPGPYTVFGTVTQGLDLLTAVANQQVMVQIFSSVAGQPYQTAPLLPVGDNQYRLFAIEQAVEISILDGDFNNDGAVNQADLSLWQSSYGQTGVQEADGNGDYIVDGQDFLLWQQNQGATVSSLASINAVPEPASLLLALTGVTLCGRRFR